jgi:diguanylate cyclase (GGDEF)-like protein
MKKVKKFLDFMKAEKVKGYSIFSDKEARVALSKKQNLPKERFGVNSRENFLYLGDIFWKQACRDEMSISVLLLEVVEIDELCNKYGPWVCEEILSKIAEILHTNVRRPLDLTGRYQKNVFSVLLYSASIRAANRISERIHNEIKQHKFQRDGFVEDIVFNVQIGIATSEKPSLESSFEELLKEAEKGFCGVKKDLVCINCVNEGKGICV